ncbi:MAG: shikimate dehydrogenase, partial [Myxococcota bacterium]|nr:shikimate dehydrogenase [Myxococcota bacterium]
GEAIARDLDAARGATTIDVIALDAMRSLSACELLIQASSATLDPAGGRRLASSLPLASLPASAHVVDLVYRPRRTAVLEAAGARGLRTVEGIGMLVHQGALALERWLGQPAPIEVMRAAVLRALG